MPHMLAFQMPGLGEWLVIGIIGLLLFGKRLPEVGRSLGKGIVEFKRGLKGVEDDMTAAVEHQPAKEAAALPQAQTYKFDPYTGKPLGQVAEATPTTPPQNPA